MHNKSRETHQPSDFHAFCAFCILDGKKDVEAQYDGRTIFQGRWAYMCEKHFSLCGVGLGLGKGQRLIREEVNSVTERLKIKCERCNEVVTVYGKIWQYRLRNGYKNAKGHYLGWNCDTCADAIESGSDY